jgi:hypothetical protein
MITNTHAFHYQQLVRPWLYVSTGMIDAINSSSIEPILLTPFTPGSVISLGSDLPVLRKGASDPWLGRWCTYADSSEVAGCLPE